MAQVISIFNFLKEYNELSNPVISELERQKWSLDISDLPKIKEIKSVFSSEDINSLIVLEVKKPIIIPCPSPDESVAEWLDHDWRKLTVDKVTYREVITREIQSEDDTQYYEERFDEDLKRISLYNDWIIIRDKWQQIEMPKYEGLNLYNSLFRLYSDMKKEPESVELILGDGILRWQTDSININHPILLQKVLLEFEPNIPSFIIKCEEIKTELYTPLLRIIPSINQIMLSDIIRDIEEKEYSVPDFQNTYGLFSRIIHTIDENGFFNEDKAIRSTLATMFSNPVIFLRKRTLGFSIFLDGIIDEINRDGEEDLPDFFGTMVGRHKENEQIEIIEDSWNESGIDQDILLTLPANNEQLKIIKYLNKYGAVLVQGPPGTGKTHTIANLIGHLLSEGKNVLVTSHTEKALTVLKEKVFKDPFNPDINLQSLCISLLSSKSQKKEMDEAINEIAIKGTTLDLHESKLKISNLESERKQLIERSKELSNKLIFVRSLEYKDIVFNNTTVTPIDAAKFIKSGLGSLDYIPGPSKDDSVGLPLSIEDLEFLYASNGSITIEDEEILEKDLPEISQLWDVETFKSNMASLLKFESINSTINYSFKDSTTLSELEKQVVSCNKLLQEINDMVNLQRALINKCIVDSSYPALWSDLVIELEDLLGQYDEIRKISLEEDINITQTILQKGALTILKEIIDSGKETPVNILTALSKPKWKAVQESITNNGQMIEKRRDFIKAYSLIKYQIEKSTLKKKIDKLLAEVGVKTILDDANFEITARQYKEKILNSLTWNEEEWIPLIHHVKSCVTNDKTYDNFVNLDVNDPISSAAVLLSEGIIPALNYRIYQIDYERIKLEWKAYFDYLNSFAAVNSSLLNNLAETLKQRDSEGYKRLYNAYFNIQLKKDNYCKRKKLIEKLKEYATEWAKAIDNRMGIHGQGSVPNNLDDAWKWRQLSCQLDRIDSYNVVNIKKELETLNNRLVINARKLAYERAWFEKIKNRTSSQAQAIEGWRTTIRQIGKGTGKRAPELMKKAKELMPLCQSAIPVWIMPLNRVVENFDPRSNKFDVVIIDEASQSNILALAALYLGKKIIIVGDDEQVSPDSIGINKDEVNALISQFLQGVPNSHLYNGQTSLYDMAKAIGFKPLMLTEHFRCLPEIIEFSNALSYNGRIKPLRDSSKVTIKPAVTEYRVAEATRNARKVNDMEAEHIASLICACTKIEEYRNKSIGVISLLGTEQSYEIDRLLQLHLDPVEYENRRIQCGTPPQFQGDERDIIFLSIVEGSNEKGGTVRLLSEDGNNDLTRKRYNVAASRAKDQMWVVHSLNPEIDLKPDDIRLRLINHARNPYLQNDKKVIEAAESPFETAVLEQLMHKGYKVIPQLKVGSYRIDMVIEDGDKRVALECDGERWHTQDDLPNDLKRQAILERLGWIFIRLRGSEFYRNPDKAMITVFNDLESHGIRPNFVAENEIGDDDKVAPQLIDTVKRIALENRSEWNQNAIEINSVQNEENEDNPADYIEPEVITQPIKTNQIIQAPVSKSSTKKEKIGIKQKEKESVDGSHIQLQIKVDMPNVNKGKPAFDFRSDKSNNQPEAKIEIKKGNKPETTKKEKAIINKNPENIQKPLFDFRNKKTP